MAGKNQPYQEAKKAPDRVMLLYLDQAFQSFEIFFSVSQFLLSFL